MSIETDVRRTVYRALIEFAGGRDVPIVFANMVPTWQRKNNPTETPDIYLRASTLPVPPDRYGVSPESEHIWLFQVSAIVRDGVGELSNIRASVGNGYPILPR